MHLQENTLFDRDLWVKVTGNVAGLHIYGGPGSLSHDFKIWPITFQGSGPSGPILFRCEKNLTSINSESMNSTK